MDIKTITLNSLKRSDRYGKRNSGNNFNKSYKVNCSLLKFADKTQFSCYYNIYSYFKKIIITYGMVIIYINNNNNFSSVSSNIEQ
jgi:hypothetical protein